MTRAAEELDLHPSSEPGAREPDTREQQLAARIADVRDQARRDPQGYLKDTVVPEGGE